MLLILKKTKRIICVAIVATLLVSFFAINAEAKTYKHLKKGWYHTYSGQCKIKVTKKPKRLYMKGYVWKGKEGQGKPYVNTNPKTVYKIRMTNKSKIIDFEGEGGVISIQDFNNGIKYNPDIIINFHTNKKGKVDKIIA